MENGVSAGYPVPSLYSVLASEVDPTASIRVVSANSAGTFVLNNAKPALSAMSVV
jgi:hypothetical protein